MKYNIIGRKVNLRDNFKERVYKKLGKFEKIYSDSAEAVVTVTVEKNRQTVEVTIRDNGMTYRAESTAVEMNDALEAFYSMQEGGEERLRVPSGIPVRSKYMTISIPNVIWENDGKTIQKAIDDFQKKFGLSDQEIKELFKRYNDTSRTAYRIKNNLPKVSAMDKFRKFSY